jgi:NAD-dependent deacetylase
VILHEKRELYTKVAARLTRETRITVLTGAGVSAASGVPTFRGPGGLWRNFRPEELATPQAFARDPRLVWEWYDWRRSLIAACRPNRAHEVLAGWSRRFAHFALITQNVDGLHEAAGTHGTHGVVRMHGSIWDVRCARPCTAGATPWRDDSGRSRPAKIPGSPVAVPECPHCGGLVRPAVVWFGEMLDPVIVSRAAAATACDVFFAVGTSAVVYPAAGLLHEAKQHGAFTVEINPDVTEASHVVDVAIAEPAEVALDAIDAMIESA